MITNVRLGDADLEQVGRLVHSSMSRAIQPLHTGADGDVLFTVTTDEVDLPGISATGLGTLAAEVAWDAVLASLR